MREEIRALRLYIVSCVYCYKTWFRWNGPISMKEHHMKCARRDWELACAMYRVMRRKEISDGRISA